MSLKPVKVILFASLPFWGNASLFAQNISRPFENNPYSRYGLGEEYNSLNPALKAMGSASVAFSDPYTLNTDNPAAYSAIKYMTYEGGGEGRRRTVFSGSEKYQTGTASVSYLTFAIPLGNFGGMAIGFKPNTKVSYQLYDTLQTAIGPSSLSYYGTGGINYFFLGYGAAYKGFSIGVNVGYLFGTIRQSSWIKTESTAYSLSNSEFLKINTIGSIYTKLGAQYEHKLVKEYSIRFGVTAAIKQNIGAQQSEFWISHPFYSSDTSGSDTSYRKIDVKSKITLPGTYDFGVQLANSDKWTLAVNYRTSNWSQYNNQGIKDSIGQNAYRLSLGASYTPNIISIYKYWQRVTYRAGLYMGKDFVSINNYQMNYYAATFGLSLPFKRGNDRLHTSMEVGRIGKPTTGTIQQNFVRFSIGLSFSDKSWFVKRRYE
ncbi:MAG: hypothetical protein QM530_08500 [Phycisphaerales bacterium]|nr:hypothetical protein [Phycisphaerales bacterium]